MKLAYILLSLSILPLASTCGNNTDEPDPGKKEEPANTVLSFTATLPDAAGFPDKWTEGDPLEVYCLKGNSAVTETMKASSLTSGGRTATFTSSGTLPSDGDSYYATVPGTGTSGYKLRQYWVSANMDGSSVECPSITVGSCDPKTKSFTMRNIFSMLKFNVTDPEVKYVVFSGRNAETVNKECFIAFSDFSVSDNPSPAFKATNSIRKNISGTGTHFIGLYPGIDLSGGYLLRAYDGSGKLLGRAVSEAALKVESGKVYTAPEFTKNSADRSPVFDENKITMSFAAISDTHVDGVSTATGQKFQSALRQLSYRASDKDKDGLDGVLVVGDLINNFSQSQINDFKSMYKSILDPDKTPLVYTIGNHDASSNYWWGASIVDDARFIRVTLGDDFFKTDLDNAMRENFECRHCRIGDYHILCMTPNGTGPVVYPANTVSWLDSQLKALTEAEPEQYVIVITHPMIYNTVYGSTLMTDGVERWFTKSLSSVLDKYPQVIVFGGHLHFPINDPRSIWQGNFTSVGCGSVRYMAIENGGYEEMSSATVMKDSDRFSQGHLVQFDENGNMRITRMDFYHESTIGEPWVLSYPSADRSHLAKYDFASRKAANSAPTLSDVTVTVGAVSGGTAPVSATFAAAQDDEFAHHYVLNVRRSSTGTVVVTKRILADFYAWPRPSSMKKSWTQSLDTLAPGDYELTVEAYDSWDAKATVTKAFTVK